MFKRKKGEEKNKNKKKDSPFFSNLNTESTIEYGYAEKNPKSKWAKWIIGGTVLGLAAVGITVPWVMSSCTLSIVSPYANSRVMYTYVDPITNKTVEVTYQQFQERVDRIQVTNSIFDKWDDVFYKNVLEQLYNEEREAFLKFKAIYNELHKSDDKTLDVSKFGADLSKSFSDIEQEQKKILQDNKKTFQKATNNSSNWLDLWIKELQTNSIYGPQLAEEGSTSVSVLEDKAIAYMVVQQIKTSALARYNGVSVSKDSWDFTDYNFANGFGTTAGNQDSTFVTYTNNVGKQVQLKRSDAVAAWKAYLNSDDWSNTLVQGSDREKVTVMETKSYSTDYRNPLINSNLFNLLNNNFKFSLLSSFTLSGLTPGTSVGSSFVITNDFLTNLFKGSTQYNINVNEYFIPFSQLSKFQGANAINTKPGNTDTDVYRQNKNDELLVQVFNADDKVIGSSKFVESSTLMSASDSSSDDSSSSEDSSSDSDSSSSSTLNMLNIAALLSSDQGATSLTTPTGEVFSINKTNPFSTFMKLLFTIDASNNIDLSSESTVKTNWNNLNYGSLSVSPSLAQFINFLKDNLNADDYTYKGTDNIEAYNTNLNELITKLSENDRVFLGQLFNAIMIGDVTSVKSNYNQNIPFTSQTGYWTLYQLSSTTYMYVSQEKVSIFSKSFTIPTLSDIRAMASNDLYQYNNSDSDSPSLYYDVVSAFSKLNNDDLEILTLLNDTQNQTIFKNAIKEVLDKDNSQASENDIYNDFYAYVQNNFSISQDEATQKIVSNIGASLKTVIDSQRTYDFATATDRNGMSQAIFQTQTLTGTSSIAQNENDIEDLFILNIQKFLSTSINKNISRKAGK